MFQPDDRVGDIWQRAGAMESGQSDHSIDTDDDYDSYNSVHPDSVHAVEVRDDLMENLIKSEEEYHEQKRGRGRPRKEKVIPDGDVIV